MKIVNIVVNNPIFIELQYLTIKKFIDENNEYIIFNDGKNWPDMSNFWDINEGREGIKNKCNELNIKCIDIPNDHHKKMYDGGLRHTDSLRFVLNYMKNNLDEYLMLDSDMFLIDKLDLDKYRKSNCVGVLQERSDYNLIYIWPNLFYMNMNTIKNKDLIDLSKVNGGDTGSATDKWLKSFTYNYNDMRTKGIQNSDFYLIKHLCSCSWNESMLPLNIDKNILNFLNNDGRNQNGYFFAEIYDNTILHYRAGSNWTEHHKMIHNKNINNLITFIKMIVR